MIIPLLNEEESIPVLYDELKRALEPMETAFELVFVNDGSTDGSGRILAAMNAEDPRVVVIDFRRNFGQTAAMSAGFDYARGDIIIAMDADLQNDPADIPGMVAKINEGCDVVTGWRYDRKDAFLNRRLPSIIANKLISVTTGVSLHDYGCTLKAFRREVIRELHLYGEMHRFIPALASGIGIRFTEVKVNHRPRRFGSTKYGISRTIRVLLDLLTVKFLLSYSTRPIHVFGSMGLISGAAGFLVALVMTIQRQFFGIPLANRPLLLLAILLIILGFQFISMGLIAEIQARTYHESQNKPIYYVRSVLRRDDESGDTAEEGDRS